MLFSKNGEFINAEEAQTQNPIKKYKSDSHCAVKPTFLALLLTLHTTRVQIH